MIKTRILAVIVLIFGLLVGYFVVGSENKDKAIFSTPAFFENFKFKLGLYLSGGTHLVYRADTSAITPSEVDDSMNALRDVIERRVNLFGVAEPVVQVQEGSFANNQEERLSIDLPGVTDIDEAVEMIGQTPLLEFKIENPDPNAPIQLDASNVVDGNINLDSINLNNLNYISTELTGRYLKRATLEFDPSTREPIVSLQFDEQGAKMFEDITRENIGKTVAIYLDGSPISTPVVRSVISGGQAQITGLFTPQEAKQLVGRLNSGALPVPIELISTQTVGATLGASAVEAGVSAGLIGFLLISAFLIFWYRLPGLIAVIALVMYIVMMLALFKIIPITLTAAGIAGFIISIGIAVDANVLIFERIKEEIRKHDRSISDAIHTGFERAWLSIRDSNTSSIITALILFIFGTSVIQGFALTFGLGVIISLVSAISITRLFLYALNIKKTNKITRFLFSSGFSK